jgi:Tol biopolymer transport system component/DNA-binding winged helix-turn-helix (wHTH) protein
MTPPSSNHRVYRFGPFELNPDAGEVRKRGIRIRVQDQPLKLLNALVERPGELITREELQRRLWPDDTFVDFEHGLNAAATRLRQALGDSAQTPRFVESIPRRGYRFIAPVELNGHDSQARNGTEASSSTDVEISSIALANCINPPPAQEGAPPVAGRKVMLAWIAASAFFMAAALVALINFRERPSEDRLITFTLLPPEGTRLGEFDSLAVSPDGRRLALTATDSAGETQLWVRRLDALSAKRLDGTAGALFPFWSPDSRAIGFFANGKLKTIDASGGQPKMICDAASGRGGSWSRKGVIVFAPLLNSPVFQVSSAGGEAKRVTALDGSRQELSHRWPVFLPDGKHFLYRVHSGEPKQASAIYIGTVDSGRSTLLLEHASNAEYASGESGNGYVLFVRDGTLMGQTFDASRLKLKGESFPVAERVAFTQYIEPLRAHFSVSGTGVLVHKSSRGTDRLTWVDRNGVSLAVIGEAGTHLAPVLSPDERQVAVDRMDPHTSTFDIYRIDSSSGVSSRFTFEARDHASPVWSPDGSRIAFSKRQAGIFDLYFKLSSGAGGEQELVKSKGWKFPTDWSPDGRFLIYYQIDSERRNRSLWALPIVEDAKTAPLLQTEANDTDAVSSPDGKWFAYSSDHTGKHEIYVQPFPPSRGAGKWMVSSGGGSRPKWTRRGKELFYLSPDKTMMAVPVSTEGGFRAGIPRPLFQTNIVNDFRARFAVTGDGGRFLIPIASDQTGSPSTTVIVNWMSGFK